MSANPKCIYIFSGKRKSGKDYLTDRLFEKLNREHVVIIKLSAPIKSLHAEKNGLDLKVLMSSLEFKEAHRKAMLEWSEKLRNEDYGVFCRAAIQMSKADNYPVWIVSDARRKTDIKWFKENYNNEIIKLYRIVCDDSIRKQRGWVFAKGIDDEETECGLDDFDDWDKIIQNNTVDEADAFINQTIEHVNSHY
nr:phosphomevalonate kinase isoform X1 [Halyomorpha halys]